MISPQLGQVVKIQFFILKYRQKQTHRNFKGDVKSKLVLEALEMRSSIVELAKKYEIHPTQIHKWKKVFLSRASSIFNDKPEKES
jgi:transposase